MYMSRCINVYMHTHIYIYMHAQMHKNWIIVLYFGISCAVRVLMFCYCVPPCMHSFIEATQLLRAFRASYVRADGVHVEQAQKCSTVIPIYI